MLDRVSRGFESHYAGVSPQLLARVRQHWSAAGLDLDMVWRGSVTTLPGFSELDGLPPLPSSRPIDLLLVFDQALAWADSLRHGASALKASGGGSRLIPEQIEGLIAVTTRLREAVAAVRMLAVAGIVQPGMQVSRSVSEDVDLALALIVRRKLARAFVACRTPEDSADFWRRHVAGGRAFRLVAQALYRIGLDYDEDSEYVRWRKEVLVFLGSAVHTSFVGAMASDGGQRAGPLNPACEECLYFTTIRLQELCAYTLSLGGDLLADLHRLPPQEPARAASIAFLRGGGDIVVDQMRWLTETQEDAADRPPSNRLN